jgi:hypothetical protein
MKLDVRSFYYSFANRPLRLFMLGCLMPLALTGTFVIAQSQSQPPKEAKGAASGGFPDLIAGLKATPGCLGVETAMTASRKQVIFAWFEDKKALLKWYYSETHQRAIGFAFPGAKLDTPLEGVPDDVGPIMAIASITMADKPMAGTNLPFSQISIELYKPVTGGIFVGSRFAPAALKVPHMKDYTPK